MEKIVGPDHPDFARLLLVRGASYALWGKLDEAEKELVRGLAILELSVGPEDRQVVESKKKLEWLHTEREKEGAVSPKDAMERLLAHQGTDVNAKDEHGFTLLHEAATKGHKDMVEFLLAKGADVNAKDNEGHTPLDHANQKRKSEVATLLTQHKGKSGKDFRTQ